MKLGPFLLARFEHLRNQRRSRTEIQALQMAKFRRLVAHAQKHSPYYRDLIASRGIDIATCGPSDFPPLTKAEMMENFDRIVTNPEITAAGVREYAAASNDPDSRFLGDFVVIASSGTRGEIGYSVFSASEWARGIALGMRSYPFTLRRRRMARYNLLGGREGGAISNRAKERPAAKLRFLSRSIDVEEPIDHVIEQLNGFQPEILSGMPASLVELANAQEAGFLRISPKVLSVGADSMTPSERELLHRAFGATISNHYASSEHLVMGYGLSGDGGMYLFDDELIFEIEDDRVLVTNLYKYTQPMIRYVMNDRLVPIDDPNPRLPFTKVRDIAPHPVPDVTFTNAGGEDTVLPAARLAEFAVPNVERIQLRVFDERSCLLRVKLKIGLSVKEQTEALGAAERQLAAIFAEAGLGSVSQRVEAVRSFGGRKAVLIVLPGTLDTMTDSWRESHSRAQVM